MLNNALYKSCLFLTSGAVEKKAGTTDLARLGGLSVRMPVTFAACLVSALAISGVPPLNGFVSKWMIYQAVLEAPRRGGALWILWLAAAMLGSALTLASFMKLLHTAFLGRASEGFEDIKEAGFSLTLPMVVLAATCVIFGVFAFSIPLSLFIIPSVGKAVTYIGLWSPAAATALIAVGIVLGLLIYYLSRPGAFRTVDGFVGGEEADSLERMSGVEFYDTIREMKALGPIYRGEESRSFDIYVLSSRVVSIFTRFFQYLHNGILPTYLVWCLLGMTAMFLVFFLR
jgi:NADH:ubiquinone oxidoreductase subunit 5 (subunit L)/multisubunit Na+/H+ antiporter MnhA subunit